ncbi:FTP domain-containing protein, partial [Caerostris extrusa]
FRLHDIQVRVGNVKLSKKWDNEIFEENSLCGENVGGGIGDAVVKIRLPALPSAWKVHKCTDHQVL